MNLKIKIIKNIMSLSEEESEDKNIDIESYKLYFEHLSKNDNFIKKKYY